MFWDWIYLIGVVLLVGGFLVGLVCVEKFFSY